jgi:IclR family acetate operon transcriptional repressor
LDGPASDPLAVKRRDPTEKALQALKKMAEESERSWGLRELGRALDLPPTTVHRVLGALESQGIVERSSEANFRLSLDFIRLALRATARFPLLELARGSLRKLVEECDETAALGVYNPVQQQMAFLATVESSKPLRYVIQLNTWIPVYASASGLGIMAFLPERERSEIIARTSLAPVTDRTITDPKLLEEECEGIRARGYALSMGARTPGAVGIGTPVRAADGRVQGDVVVTLPESRYKPDLERPLAEAAMRCAAEIGEQLGSSDGGLARQ